MKNLILFTLLVCFWTVQVKAQKIEELSALELKSSQSYILGNAQINQGLVLIFHEMACPFVDMYKNRLQFILDTYTSKGFSFVFVNPNSSEISDPASIKDYLSNIGINLLYLLDEGQTLTKFFKITKIPEIVILTKSEEGMKISYRGAFDNNPQVEGSVTDRHFERAINQILKGQEPTPSQVRAMGCNVRTF